VDALNVAKAPYGHFQVILIATLLDVCGFLTTGRSSTAAAVAFIRERLGSVDARYGRVGGLLYHMLRHGIVHSQKSKAIQLGDGRVLEIALGRDNKHLTVRAGRSGTSGANILWLNVDAAQLWADTRAAAQRLIKDLSRDSALATIFEGSMARLLTPETEQAVRDRSSYIRAEDFRYIHENVPDA
jgi:hypothetical protein